MKSYKFDAQETGFMTINGDVVTVVAHYKDGHIKSFDICDFLTLRNKNNIVQIDCYTDKDIQL